MEELAAGDERVTLTQASKQGSTGGWSAHSQLCVETRQDLWDGLQGRIGPPRPRRGAQYYFCDGWRLSFARVAGGGSRGALRERVQYSLDNTCWLAALPAAASEGGAGCFTTHTHEHATSQRSLFRYAFAVGEQRSTMALFTARADGRSATPAPLDFCKACLWQVMDASIDLRDPNTN